MTTSLSKAPFERKSPYLAALQQKLAYRQHLENSPFFMGRKKMHQLGLKQRPTAYFAYYLIARNLLVYRTARYSCPLRQRLQKAGRQLQVNLKLYPTKTRQLASMHEHLLSTTLLTNCSRNPCNPTSVSATDQRLSLVLIRISY